MGMIKYKKGSDHWSGNRPRYQGVQNIFERSKFMDVGEDLEEGEMKSRNFLKKHIK